MDAAFLEMYTEVAT